MSTPTPQTFVYKTVNSISIPVDVYLPSTPTVQPAPILLWVHGGGLVVGSRSWLPPHLLRSVDKYNLCLVAPDYRLAPQVSLPEMRDDARDAIRWAREELPGLVGEGKVDGTRLAVSGSSAGGFVGLLAGLTVSPLPKALTAFYPITNPLAPFFVTPQRPVSWYGGGEIISDEEMKPHLDLDGPVLTEMTSMPVAGEAVPPTSRDLLYIYMIQEGNLAKVVFSKSPEVDPKEYVVASLVKKDTPPTYIAHGDADQGVPIDQSLEVIDAMKKAGAVFELETEPGGAHGYDYAEEYEMEKMYAFLLKYL